MRACAFPTASRCGMRDDDTSIIDAGTFAVGTAVTVTLGAADDDASGKVFDGQVTTLAPEFEPGDRAAHRARAGPRLPAAARTRDDELPEHELRRHRQAARVARPG